MDAEYTGQQIAQRRKQLQLTQRQLAEMLHVTDKAVSKWERGVNFPDLMLMEPLAQVLQTTPADLLGLEQSDDQALMDAMKELFAEQLEEHRRDLGRMGWGCLLAVAALFLIYHFIPRHTVQAYYLITCLTVVAAVVGLYLLFHYGEIKAWEPTELFLFLGALVPVLTYLGWQFATGYSPPRLLGWVLILVASVFGQLLFLRIMRPGAVKVLPMVLTVGFALWHSLDGHAALESVLPGLGCAVTWAVWFFETRRKKRSITAKGIALVLCVLVGAMSLTYSLFYPSLVRGYVTVRRDHLEQVALEFLREGTGGSYGPWRVSVDSEEKLVLFHTDGHGLAPSSVYEGFYYALEDVHTPLIADALEVHLRGDTLYWSDSVEESDNWGKAIRLLAHWFWFEEHY